MATAAERVAKLLDKLEAAWSEFQESYAGLPDEAMVRDGVSGEWSVRDLIAHVTWWDEEALKHLPTVSAGKRLPRYSAMYGGIDTFNALMAEQKHELPVAEVRAQAEETHRRLVAYIQGLPPHQIVAEPRFRHRLRLDTYGHYPLHAKQIREWRETHTQTLKPLTTDD